MPCNALSRLDVGRELWLWSHSLRLGEGLSPSVADIPVHTVAFISLTSHRFLIFTTCRDPTSVDGSCQLLGSLFWHIGTARCFYNRAIDN